MHLWTCYLVGVDSPLLMYIFNAKSKGKRCKKKQRKEKGKRVNDLILDFIHKIYLPQSRGEHPNQNVLLETQCGLHEGTCS